MLDAVPRHNVCSCLIGPVSPGRTNGNSEPPTTCKFYYGDATSYGTYLSTIVVVTFVTKRTS